MWSSAVASSKLKDSLAAALLFLFPLIASGHGAYHEELQRADEEIAAHPEDGQHWFRRGFIHFLHGDWQASLTDLEKADRLAPGKLATDWVRGQALAAGGKLDAAKAVLDDFLAAHPEHGGALASRARVRNQLKLPDAALSDFRAALIKTANPEPDLVQEVAEALIAQNHLEEAANLIDLHLKRLGHSPALVLKALDLEMQLGRYEAALSRVDAMQKSAPRPEPWMAKRASVLAQAGRIQESRAAWQGLFALIESLPNLERGAHSMQIIAEQAQHALAALDSLSLTTSNPTPKP